MTRFGTTISKISDFRRLINMLGMSGHLDHEPNTYEIGAEIGPAIFIEASTIKEIVNIFAELSTARPRSSRYNICRACLKVQTRVVCFVPLKPVYKLNIVLQYILYCLSNLKRTFLPLILSYSPIWSLVTWPSSSSLDLLLRLVRPLLTELKGDQCVSLSLSTPAMIV